MGDLAAKIGGLVDFALNIVGLLLWFNFRASGLKMAQPGVVSLAGTLQRTEVVEPRRWFSLGCLAALLVVRALLYCQVGSQVNWIATLDLTAIALPFRSDLLGRMFWFSFLSFGVAMGVVYASLLFLSVINEKSKETDYFSRLVMLQLGWVGKLYWPIRLALGPALGALAWMAASWLFVKLGITPAPRSSAHAWQISGVMALCVVVSWKYVISLLLGLHLVNSYVYLGSSSFWQYVTLTGSRLAPAIRAGRLDFSPAVLLVAVLGGAHYAGIWLAELYRRLPL